jgi:hypothetical protein
MSKGVRHPELHDSEGRCAQPPWGQKPGFSPMAVPSTRFVRIVSIANSGWSRVPNMEVATEEVTVQATLSNGFLSTPVVATVTYKSGEREAVFEAVVEGKGDERVLLIARKMLERRHRALEKARAELERRYACFEVKALSPATYDVGDGPVEVAA